MYVLSVSLWMPWHQWNWKINFIFNKKKNLRYRIDPCFFRFSISGLCGIVAGLIPHTSTRVLAIVQSVFILLGRMGSSSAQATTFLISAELLPTGIRASALGTFSFVSCIFSLVAILMDYYLQGMCIVIRYQVYYEQHPRAVRNMQHWIK